MSRVVNYAVPQAALQTPVLNFEIMTALPSMLLNGVTTIDDTGALYLQLTVPDNVSDDQVNAVIAAWKPTDTIPPQPISQVSMAQARLALAASPGPSNNTLLDVVNNYMKTAGPPTADAPNGTPLPDTDPRQILWEYASTLTRTNPQLLQVTQALGWTSSQVDRLFLAASQINT